MGGFGCRIGKDWYDVNYAYNKTHKDDIEAVKNTNPITFGFDCVCLLKGILWGFIGDTSQVYGGAVYESNDVPDISTLGIANVCPDITEDFSINIDPGELLWMPGHVGAYIGDGLCVECTPVWAGGVQITNVGNLNTKSNYPTRNWVKHGHLPYVDYSDIEKEPEFKVGDIVEFIGDRHYLSYNSNLGSAARPGLATITKIMESDASKIKHPYHLIRTADKTSNVWGWVDVNTVKIYKEPKYTKPTEHCDLQLFVLEYGNCGTTVELLQKKLGIEITGNFDYITLVAVKNYQQKYKLQETGVVDFNMWESLLLK